MSGPLGSQQWMYATETPFYPYTIDNSLRFDGSSYLRRLSATSSAIHQFTMSFWVKISDGGSASTPYHLMSFQNYTDSATAGICLYNDAITFFRQSSAYTAFNPAKARDYSGWYHVVWKNKSDYYADIYINGVLIGTTSVQFQTINGSVISVGAGTSGNNPFAGGYMADVYFVSGQSLGPDSFGEYDSTGTIWKPKAFSGSHGTDGFHLDFADGTSATTLGYDVSGNSNNFTPSGIATSDQMLDSPTNNFATLNPLCSLGSHSEGNTQISSLVTTNWQSSSSTMLLPKSGKWYVESRVISGTSAYIMMGIEEADRANPYGAGVFAGDSTANRGVFFSAVGNYIEAWTGAAPVATWSTFSSTDVGGIVWDATNGDLHVYKNGVFIATAFTGVDTTKDYVFLCGSFDPSVIGYNFGQDGTFGGLETGGNADENGYGDFAYTPPTGALALCTQNLPDPTFDPRVGASPQDAFNVYTDTGANILSTAQSDYSDGLFWIKDYQNDLTDHQLLNTVTNTVLESNTTDAERAYSAPSGSSVAWAWKGGGSSNTFNVDGVGYGTASAAGLDGGTQNPTGATVNTKAGIGIYKYAGDDTVRTIAHGLGVAPSVVLLKNVTNSSNWIFYTNAVDGTMDYTVLNSTNAFAASGRSLTSTTFDHGADINQGSASNNYIAWVFAEKEGFSKFGSYVGNGVDDGPFVYLGFRPAFIMIKRTSSTMNWVIEDAARSPSNVVDDTLYLNLSNKQDSLAASSVDFLSNGFKIRNAATGWINAPTSTFLYMAFAEQPFRYSNAR